MGFCDTRTNTLVVAGMTAVQFAFAGWHVLGKLALNSGVNVLVFALYREFTGTLLMLILARFFDGPQWPKKEHLVHFLTLGILCAANVLGFIIALKLVTPTNASVMQLTIPVIVQLLSIASKHEKASCLKFVGMSLSIAGAALVTVLSARHKPSQGTLQSSTESVLIGNALLLLQCFAIGSSIVIQKTVLCVYPPTSVTAWYYGVAFLVTLVCVLLSGPNLSEFAIHDPSVWEALVYAVIFATAFTYITSTWANSHAPASLVATFMTLQPLATASLSMLVLHTTVTEGELLGGCLLIAGLLVTIHAGTGTSSGVSPAEQRKQQTRPVGADEGAALLTERPEV